MTKTDFLSQYPLFFEEMEADWGEIKLKEEKTMDKVKKRTTKKSKSKRKESALQTKR